MNRPRLYPTTSLPQLSHSTMATAPLSSLAQPSVNPAHSPAVTTRSQSRKSLVPSSTGCSNNNNTVTSSTRSSLPSRTSSRQLTSTSSTTSGISRRAVLGETNTLAPVSEFGAFEGKQIVVPQGLPAVPVGKRAIRPMGRTASASAGISGMGVRVGPAVRAPRSPKKDAVAGGSRVAASTSGRVELGTERDPFSLNFRAEGSRGALSRAGDGLAAGGNNNKRGFEAEDNNAGPGSSRERTSMMASPAKRPHFAPPAEASTSSAPRAFDLTSPKKSSVPLSMFSPVRSPAPRLHFYQDADADSVMLDVAAPSSPLLAIPPSSPFRSAPPPPTTTKHTVGSDSSDDDLDFLSPRKKPRAEGFGFPSAPSAATSSAPGSALRSPPKKKLPSTRTSHSTVPSSLSSIPPPSILSSAGRSPSVPSHRPTSNPMRRASYALPPPRRVPSMQFEAPPTTIDPQLLARSHLAPLPAQSGSATGLQSKYAGPAISNWRSGIPRLAQAPAEPEVSIETEAGDSSMGEANRSGMSEDTALRLAKLQSMLSKLAMPRASVGGSSSPADSRASGSRAAKVERRRTIGTAGAYQEEYEVPLTDAPAAKPRASISGPTASPSGGQSHIRPPRRSSIVATSSSTAMIAAIAEGEVSAKPKSKVLQGVVAFVDVRTLEGDDAGMIFVDMLKSMGARVTMRPTLTLTHIVYKSGRPGTLHRFRAHPDPKPFLVGISWVVRCAEVGQRVPEEQYLVDGGKEPTFQKRRKSMEPKAMASLGSLGGMQATNPALTATIAASIDRARRKSLQFAPKVGSPLAKRAFMILSEADEEN